jgi:hypothetical protein
MNKVFEVLLHQDFVFISEAHCTKGKVQAIEHRLDMMGYESFWSHGGHRRAGVGIILKKSFLKKFPCARPRWIDISCGKAAVLRLQGPLGNLDWFSITCLLATRLGMGYPFFSYEVFLEGRLSGQCSLSRVHSPFLEVTLIGWSTNVIVGLKIMPTGHRSRTTGKKATGRVCLIMALLSCMSCINPMVLTIVPAHAPDSIGCT